LATFFWDCKGVLLAHVLPCGETMTSARYSAILDELKVAIQQKRRRNVSGGHFRLLHDNARPHTAALTCQKLHELHLCMLPHPPYSPDLAPSDYYLFSPLKSALKGKVFTGAVDTQQAIQEWIASKHTTFFAAGINKLPEKWQRCIDHGGDYFEHLRENDD
jgi:transposase